MHQPVQALDLALGEVGQAIDRVIHQGTRRPSSSLHGPNLGHARLCTSNLSERLQRDKEQTELGSIRLLEGGVEQRSGSPICLGMILG